MNDINTNPDTKETSITSSDIITEMITGIPDPIKKNAIKAFGQLCTAVVDIPVAYLEGKSKEMRAGTAARVNLIESGSSQIAEQMNIPIEYVDAANNKFARKIIQEQINVDTIARNAQQELQHEPLDESIPTLEEEISTEWLNSFENEASTICSEKMQLLFGKILAGKIKSPSSYSIRTVKILAQLDSEVAELFQKFCSLCITIPTDNDELKTPLLSTIASLGKDLNEYDMSLYNLNLLENYGLIEANYDAGINATAYLKGIPFIYNNKKLSLAIIKDKTVSERLKLSGPSLSKIGRELFNIVDKTPNEKYSMALNEYLNQRGLQMQCVSPDT